MFVDLVDRASPPQAVALTATHTDTSHYDLQGYLADKKMRRTQTLSIGNHYGLQEYLAHSRHEPLRFTGVPRSSENRNTDTSRVMPVWRPPRALCCRG